MHSIATAALATFEWDWDAFVALGTLGLAAATAWLAWSTRSLAAAATRDQRAQWRPVLAVSTHAPVEYDDKTGAMSLEVRNVGRGPAFGVNAQLRSGKQPLGASAPGLGATTLATGETFRLQARVTDPTKRVRGLAVTVDVSYYDITERWHQSLVTVVGRKPPGMLSDATVVPQLEVAKVFVYETERLVLPVLGSRRALEQKEREEQRRTQNLRITAASLLDSVRQLASRLRHFGERARR